MQLHIQPSRKRVMHAYGKHLNGEHSETEFNTAGPNSSDKKAGICDLMTNYSRVEYRLQGEQRQKTVTHGY